MVIIMHKIPIPSEKVRTDLIVEQKGRNEKHIKREEKGLKVEDIIHNQERTTTIFFDDISDQDSFLKVQDVFVQELKKYINLKENKKFLVIGLGNRESTPDSLGPRVVEKILVTRYLFFLGEVEEGYSSVASMAPNVMGNTGIETLDIVQSILKQIEVDQVIFIDALKTEHLEHLGKTIQITNRGISPGSGIDNVRKELSSTILGKEVLAIGIPTVVDLRSVFNPTKVLEHFMVTPTNIDFLVEKLALLVGDGLNLSLHKNKIRQNYF